MGPAHRNRFPCTCHTNYKKSKKQVEAFINGYNEHVNDEFDGLVPAQMHTLLYDTFGERSILKLKKLSETQYGTVPILNQVKYLANSILNKKEVTLTKTGALPTKIVFDVYENGGLKEEHIEQGYVKLRKEADSISVQLSNILLQLTGIVKKRSNKLSITKKGISLINDNDRLLPLLIKTFCTKFNWAYFDRYKDEKWGQVGFGFSLVLLSRYGGIRRKDTFYAEKYYTAFPRLLDLHPYNRYVESSAFGAYGLRTFKKILTVFGLVDYERTDLLGPHHVVKTELFDALIELKI
ncbi:hypothetical protein [Winogradskyella luteola]|uniref:Uncharacterized protein n=1 Tax=Winogradskyella luteola TaxID=2828330 RepID=A0A9X1FCT9_9FLAO|nr:hypothetical protein [Winogradskyella luteola]MBV7270733.1 hypothetical protein [Winogradskyella luteola]